MKKRLGSVLISDVIDHVRNRTYMGGVERDKLRVKATGEVFTPTPLVQEMLAQLSPELFTDPSKTFLDNSCGDGQFLSEVLIRKLESLGKEEITENEFKQTLGTIYGVDLMIDNVDLCRERLLCGREDLRHIVEQNIYQADALKFSYEFKPISNTRKNREEKLRRQTEKARKAAEKAKKEQEFKDRANKLLGLTEPKVKSKKISTIKESE